MWPWGHLAVGYLLYAGYRWVLFRDRPRGWPVVALAIGTQFPDVVDKPLAYWFAVIPEGRSLAHSVFALVVVCVAVWEVTRRLRRVEWGVAFSIGYASHLLADSYRALFAGRFEELTFLLWPVLPSPDYEAADFAFHWQKLVGLLSDVDVYRLVSDWSDPFVLQLWLGLVTVLLWAYQGAPPYRTFRAWWTIR